jgi:ubiquinone/menaquinone biosynthesis C-methylase UbiE
MQPIITRPLHKQQRIHSSSSISLDAKAAFMLWAKVYDSAPNPIIQLSERAILDQVSNVHGLCVADLACGTGRMLAHLVRMKPKCCVGIDSSAFMLQQAGLGKNIQGRLIRADMHAIPLPCCSVDLAIVGLALSYFWNLELFVAELQRILRPEARILATEFHPAAYEQGWKRSFRVDGVHFDVSHYAYSPEDVTQTFKKAFQLICASHLFLDEPERPIFEKAGKSALFEQSRTIPALVLWEWKKPMA